MKKKRPEVEHILRDAEAKSVMLECCFLIGLLAGRLSRIAPDDDILKKIMNGRIDAILVRINKVLDRRD